MSKIYEALEQAQKIQIRPRIPAAGKASIPSPDLEGEMMSLYCSLQSMLPAKKGQAFEFIGSVEGEGTSTIAREFALIAAGRTGHSVLLIDNDRRRLDQFRAFNAQTEYDWIGAIRGALPPERAIFQTTAGNLFVSAISRDEDLVPELLKSAEFGAFWKSMTGQFDLILLDSSPVANSADGVLLSRFMDGVLIVVEAEKTRWPVIQSSKERIAATGGNVLGIVLNKRKYYIPRYIYNRL